MSIITTPKRSVRSLKSQSSVLQIGTLKRNVTQKDIELLKSEKFEITNEKEKLKARIARLQLQVKRANRSYSTSTRLLTKNDMEYRTIEHQIVTLRAEISAQLTSDSAAQIHELKESIKLTYEEQLRLQDLQVLKQIELTEIKREWEELLRSDGPEVYQNQKNELSELDKTLEEIKNSNHRLEKKVAKLQDQKKIENDIADGNSRGQAAFIRSQIRQIEKATAEVDKKMIASIKAHEEVMKNLHMELLQNGLDRPYDNE